MIPSNALKAGALASLGSLFLFSSLAASAADPGSNLDQVVVTATRQPSRADDQIAEVTVIGRDEIDRSRGRSLADLLGRQAGIQMASNGGLGQASSVFIRGTESRHTLLLIDGIRYGSATIGAPVLENIPLDQIDHIEIVRGPLSSLYGSEAVGGVIQIFTRRGNGDLRPSASITACTGRYGQASASLGGGTQVWDYHIGASYQRDDDQSATRASVPFDSFNPDRDGFRQGSGTASFGYRFTPDWSARVNTLYSRGTVEYDDGVPFDGSRLNTRQRLTTAAATATLDGTVLPFWQVRFLVGQSRDTSETLQSLFAEFGLSTFRSWQTQAAFENRFATPIGSLLAAYEFTKQEVSVEPGENYPVDSRDLNAVIVGIDGSHAEHHWQASARRDHNSQFGNKENGSAGYGYDVMPWLRAGVSYGTSFVAPSFNQLYFPSFGNPDLRPEKGRSKEASLRFAQGPHEARLAWFENRIRGFITSGPDPVNIPHSRIDGVTASYTAKLDRFSVGGSVDVIDPKNQATDLQLPRRARRTLHLNADTTIVGVGVGAELSMVSRRYDDAANTLRMGGYSTLDLHASYPLSRDWLVAVRLDNVTDKQYETAYGYLPPGRRAFATLSWTPL
ncbi:TonB-dependent vitamin B12 receptor [soil metagenome]